MAQFDARYFDPLYFAVGPVEPGPEPEPEPIPETGVVVFDDYGFRSRRRPLWAPSKFKRY